MSLMKLPHMCSVNATGFKVPDKKDKRRVSQVPRPAFSVFQMKNSVPTETAIIACCLKFTLPILLAQRIGQLISLFPSFKEKFPIIMPSFNACRHTFMFPNDKSYQVTTVSPRFTNTAIL